MNMKEIWDFDFKATTLTFPVEFSLLFYEFSKISEQPFFGASLDGSQLAYTCSKSKLETL